MQAGAEIKVKGTKKTIDVLNCFLKKNTLGVTEISKMLGMSKSNVHDILSTLAAMDFVEQDTESGKYYLSIGVIRLSYSVGDRFSVKNIAKPHMQLLSEETKEIIHLTAPLNNEIFYLETVRPSPTGRLRMNLGSDSYTCRMHCTASGKAMLAGMSKAEQEQYISTGLEAYTQYTITDPQKLREELEKIKRDGYAIDNMEWEEGIRCVARALKTRSGKVVGAISVTGPSERIKDERLTDILCKLNECVEKIEDKIRYLN